MAANAARRTPAVRQRRDRPGLQLGPYRSGGITVRRQNRSRRAPHVGEDGKTDGARGAKAELVDLATAAQSSPLIAQYADLKSQYPDALLLSRVGDFYEAYGADAEDLADSVSIVLTSKESGKGRRVAMAGVPHHQLDSYLSRLIRQRRVVAIAEQMEPPVPSRLVRREILRILTPGTLLEDHLLAAERNNFICAIASVGESRCVAAADVSTATASVSVTRNADEFAAELDRLAPTEAVVSDEAEADIVRPLLDDRCRLTMWFGTPDGRLESTAPVLAALAVDERPVASAALALLADYLNYLKLDGDALVARAVLRDPGTVMMLDAATRSHLDLLRGSGLNERASLLGVLSRTKSPMGARLLAQWLCAPLLDRTRLEQRHDRVASLVDRPALRFALQSHLAAIGDVERIAQKVRARRALPRDLVALQTSLAAMQQLRSELGAQRDAFMDETSAAIAGESALDGIAERLDRALVEHPPATLSDGGVIKVDYSPALRELVDLREHARDRLLALEEHTRTRSGIKSIKIKYTQAFGYYYEVTRAQAANVPTEFIRRQSLVNAERFTEPELQRLESDILSARSRQTAMEREIFEELLNAVDAVRDRLLAAARAIAELDVYCSLSQVAGERGYVRPVLVDESVVHVEAARHPILEAFVGLDFVPNDCHLDGDRRFLCITGPNMGGKSTYLRQVALCAILAQIGSFVPARRATMGVIDRLFTRIGAGDDIAAGRSTFYVEMAEMSLILRRCTPRSLLLIDEVGRGTGTTDGLAIAQAISEYLLGLDESMPMVLFATHFHELVRLAATFVVMENLHVAVAEEAKGPVFSHRLLPGASSRSYGIEVAKMAGLPEEVVMRARQIATEIEGRPEPPPHAVRRRKAPNGEGRRSQLPLEM